MFNYDGVGTYNTEGTLQNKYLQSKRYFEGIVSITITVSKEITVLLVEPLVIRLRDGAAVRGRPSRPSWPSWLGQLGQLGQQRTKVYISR